MKLSRTFYYNTFKHLLIADLIVYFTILKKKFLDICIYVGITISIMGYVMPALGLSKQYGVFQLVSLIAAMGLLDVYANVSGLVADFEGDFALSYQLTLPIPTRLILLKIVCYYALTGIIVSFLVLPLGKLILWNQFDLTKISIIKFLIIVITANLFYGVYTLWLASMISSMKQIGQVWTRYNFPLYFLGCSQFSWETLYNQAPILAYINLLNPVTLIMEGTRAAFLGQDGYLPFWYCTLGLTGFILLYGLHALVRLKKRLDFV